MISLEQLQQLKELVHAAVGRIQALERENAELQTQLNRYENDLSGLSEAKEALKEAQQLVESEVGELLHELQDLGLEAVPRPVVQVPDDAVSELSTAQANESGETVQSVQASKGESAQRAEVPVEKLAPLTRGSSQSLGRHENEDSKHEARTIGSAVSEKGPPETDTGKDDLSHSLDLSLGIGGDSLLVLEENLSALASQEVMSSTAEDDDLDIF